MRLALALLAAGLAGACSVAPPARMPTADAGFDVTVAVGQSTQLDGTQSSDPKGADLSYQWTLLSAPPGADTQLQGTQEPTLTLTPSLPGEYLVTLTVNNGKQTSLPDVAAVYAGDPAPVVHVACGDSTQDPDSCMVLHGDTAKLDARQSYDPNGKQLAYEWTQISDATTCQASCTNLTLCDPTGVFAQSLVGTGTALATFLAPESKDDLLIFQVEISDGVSARRACLRYTTTNTPPTLVLEPSTTTINPSFVDELATFTLSAAPTQDPDADSLTFSWEQIAGTPTATIDDPFSVITTVAAPEIVGSDLSRNLIFRVTVDDGLDSAAKALTVLVSNTSGD